MKQELQSKQPTVRRVTTITDVTDEKGTRRTIKVTERVTTYSKTVEVIEYGPGEAVPPAEVSDDKLQKVSLSADEFAHMMVEKLNGALGASLVADPLADMVEDAPVVEASAADDSAVIMLVDSADARMQAELEAVEATAEPKQDELDLRSKILAQSACEEPAAQPVAAVVDTPVAEPVTEPAAAPPAEPEKKKPFRLADIPDPKQVPYDEAVKELRRQKEAKAAEREAEEAKRAQEVLNSAFSPQPAVPPAVEKRAPTDAEVMDGLEP